MLQVRDVTAVLLGLLLFASCDEEVAPPRPDAGRLDGGAIATDGARGDAAHVDATAGDALAPDAAPGGDTHRANVDAAPDAAANADTAAPDAANADAAAVDSPVMDGALADASDVDVGTADVRGPPSCIATDLSPDPTFHVFGVVAVGMTSAPATFSLTNYGGANSGAVRVTLAGTNASEFRIARDGCSGPHLAAGTTCQVEVEFTPQTPGDKHATTMFVVLLPECGGAVGTSNMTGSGR